MRVTEGEARVAAPLVEVAAGRVPNTDQLGLAAAGMAVGPDGRIPVSEDMRIDGRTVAIGDVVDGPARAHTAIAQGVVAARR